MLDELIHDQFIFGVSNENLQKRLLETDGLTLKMAVEKALAHESARRGAAVIREGLCGEPIVEYGPDVVVYAIEDRQLSAMWWKSCSKQLPI